VLEIGEERNGIIWGINENVNENVIADQLVTKYGEKFPN